MLLAIDDDAVSVDRSLLDFVSVLIHAGLQVAKVVGCAPMQVYETASFYSMFNRSPIGKYFVQVCGTTPCKQMGFDGVMAACEEQLGITSGHTTADKKFTLLEVECLGACVHAPMMQINDLYYVRALASDSSECFGGTHEGHVGGPDARDDQEDPRRSVARRVAQAQFAEGPHCC